MSLTNTHKKIVMKTLLTSLAVILFFNVTGYSQVTQAWLQRYNGPGNGFDAASSLVLDTAGNIYVIGTSSGFTSGKDITTIKYNPAGTVQWLQRYDAGSDDEGDKIAVDKAGNVYVTGNSSNGTNYDYVTIKYNSMGVQQWLHRYNGPGNGDDYPTAMMVDTAGEVYVTGYSVGVGGNFDYLTLKYPSSGSLPLWNKRYNGTGSGTDQAYSVAVDNSGNVYVTGVSYGSGTGNDYYTIKYNSFGIFLWEQRYNGTGNGNDYAQKIILDDAGNVYVTGFSAGSGSGNDCVTIKYNNSGVIQWTQRYNAPANSNDYGSYMALDAVNNLYVAGNSTGIGTSDDNILIKYSSGGIQQWVQRYNGPQNGDEFTTSMTIDKFGNIYVTGSSIGASNDFVTIKYNSAGILQWEQRYNGPGNFIDVSNSIAVDKTGNVYIAGDSYGSGNNDDFVTIKYTQPVGINTISNEVPSKYLLSQNYPNPFNPATNIRFDMKKGDFVSIKVFDMLGKEIENLVSEYKDAGSYEINFDASKLQSGVYFYKMETLNFIETKKMILVK